MFRLIIKKISFLPGIFLNFVYFFLYLTSQMTKIFNSFIRLTNVEIFHFDFDRTGSIKFMNLRQKKNCSHFELTAKFIFIYLSLNQFIKINSN